MCEEIVVSEGPKSLPAEDFERLVDNASTILDAVNLIRNLRGT